MYISIRIDLSTYTHNYDFSKTLVGVAQKMLCVVLLRSMRGCVGVGDSVVLTLQAHNNKYLKVHKDKHVDIVLYT